MGIKFGEIKANQIIENEITIKFLTKIIAWIIDNNSNVTGPSEVEINRISDEAVNELREKYPKSIKEEK